MDNTKTKKLSEFPVNNNPGEGDLIPSIVLDENGKYDNVNIPFSALRGEKGDDGNEGPPGPAGGVTSVNGAQGDVQVLDNAGASTNNAVVRFDGNSGKMVKDSKVTIDDDGGIITVGGIKVTGETARARLDRPTKDGTVGFDFQTNGLYDWVFGLISGGTNILKFDSRRSGQSISMDGDNSNVGIKTDPRSNKSLAVNGNVLIEGRVEADDAVLAKDLVTKQQLDTKMTSSNQPNKVYITDPSGNNGTIGFSIAPSPSTLVTRDPSGRVKAQDPVADEDVVTKKYLQDNPSCPAPDGLVIDSSSTVDPLTIKVAGDTKYTFNKYGEFISKAGYGMFYDSNISNTAYSSTDQLWFTSGAGSSDPKDISFKASGSGKINALSPLVLSRTPQLANEAATKDYVDTALDTKTDKLIIPAFDHIPTNSSSFPDEANDTVRYSKQAEAFTLAFRGPDAALRVGEPIDNDHAATKAFVLANSGGGSAGKTYCLPDGTEDYEIPTDATVVMMVGSHIGTMVMPEATENKVFNIVNAGGDPIAISGVSNTAEVAATKQVTMYAITVDEGASFMWASIDSGTITF